MSSAPQTAPSPEIIFDTLNAFLRTGALRGGIELDLFTAIGEGAIVVPAIAAKIQASEKGTRVLCDYLTIIGLLTKDGAPSRLPLESAFVLHRNTPAFPGSMSQFL